MISIYTFLSTCLEKRSCLLFPPPPFSTSHSHQSTTPFTSLHKQFSFTYASIPASIKHTIMFYNQVIIFHLVTLLLIFASTNATPYNTTHYSSMPCPPEGRAGWPKRGLPFNNPPRYIRNFNAKGSQVNWAYNWDSYMPADFPNYMEFVPMLHSNRREHTDPWFAYASNALSRGSGHLLSFNEPDGCGWGQRYVIPQFE